ncbi:NACHT domain-containing protein [Calothrix sp. FACHB-156]|nr:NACHT domain-containing protein [Calothrix sp. FACHB-156]
MSDPLPFADPPDGISQIHQNVTGDRNQVIGRMLGGIVINQLTIHDRVPAAAALPPISVAPSLTQQEYRQRQVLLNKVKEYWVKGVLETSLHTRALIELGLQERLDLVQRPFHEVAEFPEISATALAEGTSVSTVFEQMGAGRTLLILGEPGSGKTITLLKLAEDLISRTEKDLSQPIPVVFNLSSWAKKSQAIKQWLIQELLEKYQVSKALGKQWVETESLILLLDGLDEVKAEQRNACVQALNQFMQAHSTTEVIICCRIKDYQALNERLVLRTAICIQSLTKAQINQYLAQAGAQLSTLLSILHQDEELQDLATSPLLLSIMSLAYQNSTSEDILQGGTQADYRKRLFDQYIKRLFERRGTTQLYLKQQTQGWLVWLAQRMTIAVQTVFLIERLQPDWLPSKIRQIHYRLASLLTSVLLCTMLFGLAHSLLYGLSAGLPNGIPLGCIAGLITGLIAGHQSKIKTVETLKWSWREAKSSCRNGFIYGLAFGLLFGLINGFAFGITKGVVYGVEMGLTLSFSILLISLFIAGLTGGLRGPTIQRSYQPNQGIWQSAKNALIVGLIGSLIFGTFFGIVFNPNIGLGNGLTYGLICSVICGGWACFQHFNLRCVMYFQGYAPWNYAQFLDYCTDRLFLQKVGGGYIFVHRMLMEHFAEMPLEQGRR